MTRAIAGIVSAGGNIGSMAGGILFDSDDRLVQAVRGGFLTLGPFEIGTAFLLPLLYWPQYGGMFCGPRVSAKEEETEGTVPGGEKLAGVGV